MALWLSVISGIFRSGPSRSAPAINVHPNLHVTVQAPEGTELDQIEQKIKKRAPGYYGSSETHRYLGRQYRLKIAESSAASVKLSRGYFYINLPDKNNPEQVEALLNNWYRHQAQRVFQGRLAVCLAKLHFLKLDPPAFEIRPMQARWGSCTSAGKIILNLKLIQVPKLYLDYVITHELCHLKEHNHSQRFYELLDRVMPNWRERRQKLNEVEVG
jgi:predicted metal-dependent hydrolase